MKAPPIEAIVILGMLAVLLVAIATRVLRGSRAMTPTKGTEPPHDEDGDENDEDARAHPFDGACRYCHRPGGFPMPQLRLERPLFDRVLRRFGVISLQRWRIDLEPGLDAPTDLCELHQAMARSLLEGRLAKLQGQYAEFAEGQFRETYRFVDSGLLLLLREQALDDESARSNAVVFSKRTSAAVRPRAAVDRRDGLGQNARHDDDRFLPPHDGRP